MKKILCLLVLLLFSGLAFGQAANHSTLCNGIPNRLLELHRLLRLRQLGQQPSALRARSRVTRSSRAVADIVPLLRSPLQILPVQRSPVLCAPTPIVVSGVITGFTGGTGGAWLHRARDHHHRCERFRSSGFSNAGSALCRRRPQIYRCIQEPASRSSGYQDVSWVRLLRHRVIAVHAEECTPTCLRRPCGVTCSSTTARTLLRG